MDKSNEQEEAKQVVLTSDDARALFVGASKIRTFNNEDFMDDKKLDEVHVVTELFNAFVQLVCERIIERDLAKLL